MSKLVFGPFLGVTKDNCIQILISLPGDLDVKKIECVLSSGLEITRLQSDSEFAEYNLFKFIVPISLKGKSISYTFISEGTVIDLGGLTAKDCHFNYDLDFNHKDDFFSVVSCNNPFAADGKKSIGGMWDMWERLENVTRTNHCKLLLLGGDQVYCDEIENGELKAPRVELLKESDRSSLRADFISQYLKYWSNLSVRKIMARTPSLAMWDDHDITDGWGSRRECFDQNTGEVKPCWRIFYEEAELAFKALQISRNPECIFGSNFTTSLDLGDIRFYLFDFRSERNFLHKKIWSSESEKQVLNHLENTPEMIKKTYLLSPVVTVREDPETYAWVRKLTDFFLKNSKKYRTSILPFPLITFSLLLLFVLGLWMKSFSIGVQGPSYFAWEAASFFVLFVASLGAAILFLFNRYVVNKKIATASDDLLDTLSSEVNIVSFRRILKSILSLKKKGKDVMIIAGDLHAGGMSEVIFNEGGVKHYVSQVVSSPIGYYPMPSYEEALTSEQGMIDLGGKVYDIKGRNLFYKSKRNFLSIYPRKKTKDLEFHFEGHTDPIYLNSTLC
jgi:hypothetical protein